MPRILHDEVPQMHWHGVNLPKIREIEALRRMTFLFGATIHGFDHMVTRVVLFHGRFGLEGKMVGVWLPRRASAELSIFPARGRAVRAFSG